MEYPEKRFRLTDEPVDDDDSCASVAGKRFRRCVGCVRCLTETPGRCVLKDGFPEISDRIMDSDVLEIRSESHKNGMSPTILKLSERLSNELQAFTELGGNEPRSKEEVRLRKIVIVMRGDMEDRKSFESETLESLRMGPVEEVEFEYV
jgi:multimeric flavodoxin WrbA